MIFPRLIFAAVLTPFLLLTVGLGQRNVASTACVGGGGGDEFRWVIPEGGRITGVQPIGDKRIDGLRIYYVDKNGDKHHTGWNDDENGGGMWLEYFDIPTGTFLVGISGRTGRRVDQLKFHLNNGDASISYGGNGGNAFELMTNRKEVVGFHGREGDEIDCIGLTYIE